MHGPKQKRKSPSSEINIYRDACRDLIARHPFKGGRRAVLMRLVDYVNRYSWDAFVSEETLARDCHVNVRTARRALEDARALGIIERTRRGTQWTGASHHVFKVAKPEDNRTDNRTPVADNRTRVTRQPDTGVQ